MDEEGCFSLFQRSSWLLLGFPPFPFEWTRNSRNGCFLAFLFIGSPRVTSVMELTVTVISEEAGHLCDQSDFNSLFGSGC